MILAGSPEDSGFSGGSIWTPSNDPSLALLTAEYQHLRYGPSFSYDFPAETGHYVVHIGLFEPNATRIGQRLMSITVNGRTASPVDIFRAVGLKAPLIATFYTWVDFAQPSIHVSLSGQVGNAVVSWIDWSGYTWADL